MVHGNAKLAHLPVMPMVLFGDEQQYDEQAAYFRSIGYAGHLVHVHESEPYSHFRTVQIVGRVLHRFRVAYRSGMIQIPVVRVPGKTRMGKADRGDWWHSETRAAYRVYYATIRRHPREDYRFDKIAKAAKRSYDRRNSDWVKHIPFWKRYGLNKHVKPLNRSLKVWPEVDHEYDRIPF